MDYFDPEAVQEDEEESEEASNLVLCLFLCLVVLRGKSSLKSRSLYIHCTTTSSH